MPQRTKQPELVRKQILLPADWVDRIDSARGEEPFSDFVRRAVRAQLGDVDLSEMPAWGQGRPPKNGRGHQGRR